MDIKKCEYCQGNKPLLKYNEFGDKGKFKIVAKEKYIFSDVEVGNGELNLNIPINYCPICGRKLEA